VLEQEKMIGVVAGVGPLAGLDLLGKITEQTIAECDQEHLAVVSISQPGEIVDRTAYLLDDSLPNPAVAIAGQLRRLAQMGAQVAGIPCNTAHAPAIFTAVQHHLSTYGGHSVHLLHMIEEVGLFLRQQFGQIKRVGVLSTTGAYQAGIYPQILQPMGFAVVVPSWAEQESLIHPAIYDAEFGIKACGRKSEQARENLLVGVALLKDAGADAVVLGCTEIPLVIPEPEVDGLAVVDPTLILARALIREAAPHKLRPYSEVVG
jgi:aspartate racemase